MKANEFLHKKDVAYMNRLSVSLDFNAIVSLMEEYAALRQPPVSGALPPECIAPMGGKFGCNYPDGTCRMCGDNDR